MPLRSSSPTSSHESNLVDDDDECEDGITESMESGEQVNANDCFTSDTETTTEEEMLCEEGEEEEKLVYDEDHPNVIWTGVNNRSPLMLFSSSAVLKKDLKMRQAADKYNMSFKIYQTECKLVRSIFHSHGFHEVHSNTSDYNILWTGGHLKPYMLRSMCEFQRINHFPRSYELTRKDRLYKNVQRMQHIKGVKHFDFVPPSFIIPSEFQDLCNSYMKDKGNHYIVKPVASSRGRGIFLCSHPDQIPLDETMICSKYVSNPYLIDGFKFDVRFYVAVTSYDPLVIYLYEEGLTRFATMKYQQNTKFIKQQFMHLTNYSINKKNQDFVQNDDADIEDFGNKWSLGAVLRYLRAEGKDTTAIMMRIEDVIIKAIISVESHISTATKMFQPSRNICFELYGFDIILDENLRPWLLEVNLSPSLACDSPLDFKIKCNLLTDLFSLVGIPCQDPSQRSAAMRRANGWTHNPINQRRSTSAAGPRPGSTDKTSQQSGGSTRPGCRTKSAASNSASNSGLTAEEIRIVRKIREEYQRRGGWLRIFPTKNSWDLYGGFIQSTTNFNHILHQKLFPSYWQEKVNTSTAGSTDGSQMRPSSAASFNSSGNGVSQSKLRSKLSLHSISTPYLELGVETSSCHSEQFQKLNGVYNTVKGRAQYYERKLGQKPSKKKRKKKAVRLLAHSPRLKTHHRLDNSRVQPAQKNLTLKDTYFRGNLIKDDQELESELGESESCLRSQGDLESVGASGNDVGQPESMGIESQAHAASLQPSEAVSSSASAPQTTASYLHRHKKSPVMLIINKGDKMTKIQARNAFATYLARVQKRLLIEGVHHQTYQTETDSSTTDPPDEQMDLVLRFLKRAAKNVTPEFKIVIPSKKLPLSQRKHILATMLNDFIRIYKKETEQMTLSDSRSGPTQSEDNAILEKEFKNFLDFASESELERILTNYTRVNKSAGIFISSRDHETVQPLSSSSSKSLVETHHVTSYQPKHSALLSSVNNSLRSAAIAYSQRLKRPSSASASLKSSSYYPTSNSMAYQRQTGGSRPGSSIGTRNPYNYGMPSVESYDDVAINDALQRLALRQHSRQYSASKVETILDKGGLTSHSPSNSSTTGKFNSKRTQSTSASTLYNPIRRPGSAMPSYGRQQQQQQEVGAVNHLLHQFQQSKNLLEHSKAKHDAMIAKAVSLSSSNTDKLHFSSLPPANEEQANSKHPKPPSGPKPSNGTNSHHRYSSASRPYHNRLLVGAE